MAIMLTHNDLAERNIMVDAKGNVTGLLDWEYLDLQSLLFMKMKPHPEFVGSDEEEQNEVDDDIEMMSNSDEETEDELSERLKLEHYVTVTAHLRMVYVKRLLQLESPLLELLEREETSDTILRDRILYAIENDQEMIDWVNDQVEVAGGKGSTVRGDGHGLPG